MGSTSSSLHEDHQAIGSVELVKWTGKNVGYPRVKVQGVQLCFFGASLIYSPVNAFPY